jgi:hypothetical protein
MDWNDLTQDRGQWREGVPENVNVGSGTTGSFSRRAHVHGYTRI